MTASQIKQDIRDSLEAMRRKNLAALESLTGGVSVTVYADYCRVTLLDGRPVMVWSDAFNAALRKHAVVRIPARREPYYIDKQIIVPSDRRIVAEEGAVMRQLPGVTVLMLRNERVADGTHVQTSRDARDRNISIDGGRWEESYTGRAGYGRSGKYDEKRSMYGVSTCMLFSGVDGLTLTNLTFYHTAGFAVQLGNASDVVCEDIRFESCFADGLHMNGFTENIIARRVSGEVGDDLVALNMYDWLNSSVNFGPMKNVLCEDLELSASSRYKAIRIAPGVHYFDDGSAVDCRAENIILSNVRGIITYKMYLQTPAYFVDEGPEPADMSGGNNIFFENIKIDLTGPVDSKKNYLESDVTTGSIGAFEIGSDLGLVSFENIDVTLHRDRFPLSYLVTVGPKSSSSVKEDGRRWEIFDPYVSCTVGKLSFKNIRVNGSVPDDIGEVVKTVVFDRIYDGPLSSGAGEILETEYIK